MSNPITQEGIELIKSKFDELKEERAALVIKKEDAYQEGDPADNSEYNSAIEELSRVENLMSKYESIILTSQIIDSSAFTTDSVKFGLRVVLENENTSEQREFQVVGTDEVDVTAGKISNISPLGKSLMGKEVDDEVFIGEDTYFIVEIKH